MMMVISIRVSTVLGFLLTLLFDNNTAPCRQLLPVYPAQIIPNTQSNPRGSSIFSRSASQHSQRFFAEQQEHRPSACAVRPIADKVRLQSFCLGRGRRLHPWS